MNNWRIIKCGSDTVTEFAVSELKRYIKMMDPASIVDLIIWKDGMSIGRKALLVGISDGLSENVPCVPNKELDDAIAIDVENGVGYITGSNTRSVLIAVYRFLREVGCSFVRPGPEGEIIPEKNALTDTVRVFEAAYRRYRGVVDEGAQGYEHAADLVDWLSKNAMNVYYTQSELAPMFFRRWYKHNENPDFPEGQADRGEPLTDDEARGMTDAVLEEIYRRGIMLYAVGHGWTTLPVFNTPKEWVRNKSKTPPEYAKYIALINGERAVLPDHDTNNTNLCYSMDFVREQISDAVLNYCLSHPKTDFVCFCLADGLNNHCECENCRKMIPSDWYLTMLNEIDAKLTAADIKARLVVDIYVDLLWEPQVCRFNNPDRFILQFAPISRNYSTSYKPLTETGVDLEGYPLAPYTRNKLEFPDEVEVNMARMKRWQKLFPSCDTCTFEYHLWWENYLDPTYMHLAKVMHEDIAELENYGINGLLSCQSPRICFPSGIVMEVMARTLWNKNERFEDICADYFDRCYGNDGGLVCEFFNKLEKCFDPPKLRSRASLCGKTEEKERAEVLSHIEGLKSVKSVCRDFAPVAERGLGHGDRGIVKNWEYLRYYLRYAELFADWFIAVKEGNTSEAIEKYQIWFEYIRKTEPSLHRVFEVYEASQSLRRSLPNEVKKAFYFG